MVMLKNKMVNGLVELTDECIRKIECKCDKYCSPELVVEKADGTNRKVKAGKI